MENNNIATVQAAKNRCDEPNMLYTYITTKSAEKNKQLKMLYLYVEKSHIYKRVRWRIREREDDNKNS